MITEEKVKVYLEDLKKAKDLLEKISTELKESEGERIRKKLINLIKELASAKLPIMTSGYFVDGQDKDYIAWLEKQKEQKPVDWEKTVEFNCIGKQVTMTIQELINYYIDREGTDVAIECGF